ncbi:MAG: YaaA family protein [Prevotella sp.]|nr:YaaA family protein [Prevotella sp.]
MQILLASAKIMNTKADTVAPVVSRPRYESEAAQMALELCQWSTDELARRLQCSTAIAADNHLRYQQFADESQKLPAVLAYYGQAYKYLKANELTADDLRYAQDHLLITSFLYGLLRPLDLIHPYRMEGKVRLAHTADQSLFDWWKPLITDMLIDAVKADDGVLLHLATEEMEHLFDWRRVEREVRVVQPLFYAEKGDVLKVVTVYAKSCRGAMARYALTHRAATPEALSGFSLGKYVFDPRYGDAEHPHFVSR